MSLRDKPKTIDFIGMGFRGFETYLTARDEHRKLTSSDPWDYEKEDWVSIDTKYWKFVMRLVEDYALVEDAWDGNDKSYSLHCGTIHGERFSWIASPDGEIETVRVRTDRKIESFGALGNGLWKEFDCPRLACTSTGFAVDRTEDSGIVATGQMTQIAGRVRSFLNGGVARSYLFAGPPGTGKSVAIRWLASELGLTSLRVDLRALTETSGAEAVAADLEDMLYLLRPEVLILDDIDRAEVTPSLLTFLELAQRICRVVIGSANSVAVMRGACVRPGRFDEIMRIDKLDQEVLKKLVGTDVDLIDQLKGLPIAYVVEVLKRVKVLGREQALLELDELLERAKITSADGDG